MKFYFKLALLALIAAGVFAATGLIVTSRPEFCNLCHEMQDDLRAWASSEHERVPCLSCHVEPGLTNFLKHKFGALSEVVQHFKSSYHLPINQGSQLSKELSAANCISCHKSLNKESNHRLKFEHEEHKINGFTCAYCHNRVGHPKLPGYEGRITKQFCVDCHRREKATIACNSCHPARFKLRPASHDKANWTKVHDERLTKDCTYCHNEETWSCDSCHGLPMPHPANWNSSHANEVSRFGLCSKCHEDQYYCERCHHQGYEPTRESWRRVHPRVIKAKRDSGCRTCHNTSFCDNCHRTANRHPAGWLSNHVAAVRGAGSSKCVRCHSTRFCTNCHTSKNPHPANWLKLHENPSSLQCAYCHTTSFCDNCHARQKENEGGND